MTTLNLPSGVTAPPPNCMAEEGAGIKFIAIGRVEDAVVVASYVHGEYDVVFAHKSVVCRSCHPPLVR